MHDLPKSVKVEITRAQPKTQYLESQATGVYPWFAPYYKRQIRGRGLPMPFNYHDRSDEFIGWALISLIAGDKTNFEELSEKTNKWNEVDLKVTINGIEVDTEHFMESMEGNMKWWAEKKAQNMMEDIMDGVREEVDKVEDVLREASVFIKTSLQEKLGISFPED